MTKSELVEVLIDKTGLAKTKAEEVVNVTFAVMSNALAAGNRVEIRGFKCGKELKERVDISTP